MLFFPIRDAFRTRSFYGLPTLLLKRNYVHAIFEMVSEENPQDAMASKHFRNKLGYCVAMIAHTMIFEFLNQFIQRYVHSTINSSHEDMYIRNQHCSKQHLHLNKKMLLKSRP